MAISDVNLAPDEPEQTQAQANVEPYASPLTTKVRALLDLLVELALADPVGAGADRDARAGGTADVESADP